MKKLSPKNDKNVKDLKTAQKELDAEMHKNDAEENKVKKDDTSIGIHLHGRASIKESEEEGAASLWLITFTDVMALMLTFFVLLYSMSSPGEENWNELTNGLYRQFNKYKSPEWYQGPQDTIDIDKLDFSTALNLNYLNSIIADTILKHDGLKRVNVFPQTDHLVISLPQDVLFPSGSAEVSDAGKQALFLIGGSLANIVNRIEVIGHTDPRPIEQQRGEYESNWELSLRRAMSVAGVLEDVGYDRGIIMRGLSFARYSELPEEWNEQQKLDLSRRVDILVMKDDGTARQHMEFK